MTIMSKDSQLPPDPRPDPLAQYPERYAMTPEEHQERYRRLTAAGHKVWPWKDDPTGLRDYEKATAGNKPKTDEQRHKEMADTKKDIEYERDHGEMRPREPEQYDEASQTEPTTTGDKVTTPEWVKSIPPPKPLNPPIEQSLNVILPPRKKKPPERDGTRDFLKDMRALDRKNRRAPIDPPPKRL